MSGVLSAVVSLLSGTDVPAIPNTIALLVGLTLIAVALRLRRG